MRIFHKANFKNSIWSLVLLDLLAWFPTLTRAIKSLWKKLSISHILLVLIPCYTKMLTCPKYFVFYYLKNVLLLSTSLIMIQVSEIALFLFKKERFFEKSIFNESSTLSNITFWPKSNMWTSVYRKSWRLELSWNLFTLCFY